MNFYKREYNSERRRKQLQVFLFQENVFLIRENITPRGDGNNRKSSFVYFNSSSIRENITPRGDGNYEKSRISWFSWDIK